MQSRNTCLAAALEIVLLLARAHLRSGAAVGLPLLLATCVVISKVTSYGSLHNYSNALLARITVNRPLLMNLGHKSRR